MLKQVVILKFKIRNPDLTRFQEKFLHLPKDYFLKKSLSARTPQNHDYLQSIANPFFNTCLSLAFIGIMSYMEIM